jgi:hypothetical protein
MQNFQKDNIILAVETIAKSQNDIGTNIQQREQMLTKWNQMLTQELFPADLKFKISGYKQYPKTMSKESIENIHREEEELVLDFRKKMFALRIKAYQNDYESLKAKICLDDASWQREMDTFIPDLSQEGRDFAICYRNNLLLRKTIGEKANPRLPPALTPTPQQPTMDIVDNPMQEQLNQMQKEVNRLTMALKKQSDMQQSDKYRRQKNGSGSGTGSTKQSRRDNNAYHAASRSNSRPPSKSTTSRRQQKNDQSTWRDKSRGRSPQRSPGRWAYTGRGRSQSRGRSPHRKNNRSQSRQSHYRGKGKQDGAQRRSNSKRRN